MNTTITNTNANTVDAGRNDAEKAAAAAITAAAAKPEATTAEIKAAIAAAGNAKPASDAAKPADTAKPTGQVLPDLTAKPATAAPQGGKAAPKGKGNTAPKGDTKAVDTKAKPDDQVIEGFDLSRWPAYAAAVKPARWAILAAATPLVGGKPVYKPGTSNHLALACYLMMGKNPSFNYFDIGECVGLVRNTQPDNKSNCANRWQSLGLAFIEKVSPVPFKNPNKTGVSGGRMAYGLVLYRTDPTGKVTQSVKADVVRKIQAYLEANNCKAPAHLFGPLAKPELPSK